jgi:hypothetical protein
MLVINILDFKVIGKLMKILTTQSGLPRVSWGSVIAGVILSLITYFVLSVLGATIGMSALASLSRPSPLQGFGFSSGAYLIVMTVIAVFVGSYFAGRCAPVLGWLHGLLAWAVMILMVIYGATSLLGSAVSVAGSVASTGATVGATIDRSGATGTAAGTLAQRVQGAIASATAEASSPQAQADARQAADTAVRNVARASWFSFAALMVGAIIAIVSGHAGFRHQPPFEEAVGASTGNVPLRRDAAREAIPGRTVPWKHSSSVYRSGAAMNVKAFCRGLREMFKQACPPWSSGRRWRCCLPGIRDHEERAWNCAEKAAPGADVVESLMAFTHNYSRHLSVRTPGLDRRKHL